MIKSISRIITTQNQIRIKFKDDNFYYYWLLSTHTPNNLYLLNSFGTVVFNDLIYLFSFSHISYEKHIHQLSFTKAACKINRRKKKSWWDTFSLFYLRSWQTHSVQSKYIETLQYFFHSIHFEFSIKLL
jgi:hypothetical protein